MNHETLKFFNELANHFWIRDFEKRIGMVTDEYEGMIIDPLRQKLINELERDNLPPIRNSSNIIPCVLVFPEELIPLDEQYKKLEFNQKQFSNLARLSFFGRHPLPDDSVKPYIVTNIAIRGPSAYPAYLLEIDDELAKVSERMLYVEEFLGVLLAMQMRPHFIPHREGAGGDVVIGRGSVVDEIRKNFSVPVVDFKSSYWTAVIKYFTSDKKCKIPANYRFFSCGKVLKP